MTCKILVVAALVLAALLLRVYQLDVPSYTWDEATDREIAFSYLLGQDLTTADREPSQARLPIYLEALVIKYWEDSEVSLRSISVAAGLLSLLAVWQIGRRAFDSRVGLMALALGGFSPFHLMISRLSGTHGDALFAFLYTLAIWVLLDFWEAWERSSYGSFGARERSRLTLFGLVAGIATGAKLSGALLLVNLLLVALRGRRAWRRNVLWMALAVCGWLLAFLFTSPIYLRPENIAAAWQDQWTFWEQIRGFQFLGRAYDTLPGWYWAVVIPIKFTIPVALALSFQFIWLLVHWRRITALQRLLLFNLFPLAVLVTRRWQSPTYVALLIGPFLTLAARSLVQLGEVVASAWRAKRLRRVSVAAALGLLLVMVENGRVLAITHPDYLMTGYDFGDEVIGQFWGPAVYHCQGAGQALQYLSTQPPGAVLAPEACTMMLGYYRIVYDLPEIVFQSRLERPEDVLEYDYVVIPYSVTYMTTPYPLLQDTRVLRKGVARHCTPIYAYAVGKRELFWVYRCVS